MNNQIRLFLFALFICSSSFFAQNHTSTLIQTQIHFGLPKEVPFKWNDASYVHINPGQYFKALYLVSKDNFKTTNDCSLFKIEENGFSFSAISFQNNETTIELKNKEEDLLSPLKILVDPKERIVYYRWETNSENYNSPVISKDYELKPGKDFPVINVETTKGNWTNKNSNKIIIINWWATSCLPCKEEIPVLNKLVDKYQDQNIEFIAIVWDKSKHSKFIEKNPFKYLQGFTTKELTDLFGEIFPRHIIVDKDGKILLNKLGGSKQIGEELDSIIGAQI